MGVVEGVDELDEVERRTFEEDDGPVDCSNMAYTKICNGVRTLFPPLQWIPEYSRSDLKGDLTSGITVGCMLVPQSMAYAVLADLPPQNGLYASFIGLVVYLSLIHISEPTRLLSISYAVFCLKKKKKQKNTSNT
eukprot:TRINITY_DN54629_c0_g1_i1.p1 TRINITY_DN54629_c0_g1~~TRINITY_DN54629_c0_g1_i1.p1  ORF type:complete len:135 (+),score=35.19 TRINITY_DN54629_c0_g1_i1:3-407(+)